MRITGVEAFPIALPFREPYIAANGTIGQREMAVLRLTSDSGDVGHGDAVPMSLRGGPGLAVVLDDLDGSCAEALSGSEIRDEKDIEAHLCANGFRDIFEPTQTFGRTKKLAKPEAALLVIDKIRDDGAPPPPLLVNVLTSALKLAEGA